MEETRLIKDDVNSIGVDRVGEITVGVNESLLLLTLHGVKRRARAERLEELVVGDLVATRVIDGLLDGGVPRGHQEGGGGEY